MESSWYSQRMGANKVSHVKHSIQLKDRFKMTEHIFFIPNLYFVVRGETQAYRTKVCGDNIFRNILNMDKIMEKNQSISHTRPHDHPFQTEVVDHIIMQIVNSTFIKSKWKRSNSPTL